MVCHFLRDRVVHCLCDLIHQSHKILIEDTGPIQIVGSSDKVGQPLGSDELVRLGPALHSCWQK